jgi:hypothetical protein
VAGLDDLARGGDGSTLAAQSRGPVKGAGLAKPVDADPAAMSGRAALDAVLMIARLADRLVLVRKADGVCVG